MSNLLVNIRLYIYHLQIDDRYHFKISRNDYHKNNKETPFFMVYKLFGYIN